MSARFSYMCFRKVHRFPCFDGGCLPSSSRKRCDSAELLRYVRQAMYGKVEQTESAS